MNPARLPNVEAASARRTGWLEPVAAFAIYATLSVVTFGIPLLRDFSHLRLGYTQAGDPQVPIWGLAWYPYALTHGLDPLFTSYAWAPAGCTLAWSTTIPGASMAMWPVTRLFGLVAAYNLLCLMTPALSGLAAFLLCRQTAGNFKAAVAGGLIFGFSSYVTGQLLSHVSLAMVFLVPLFPYLCLRRIGGTLGRGRFIATFTALAVAQFLLSPEIITTTTLLGLAAVLLALRLFDGDIRLRLIALGREVAIAYSLSAALLMPYLFHFFPSPFGIGPIYNPAHCSADLLNFIVPVEPSLLAHAPLIVRISARLGAGCEPTAFAGLLILIAALYASRRPRSAEQKFLILLLTITVVASLGPVLHLGGRALFPMPWLAVLPLPMLNNALPVRFTAYIFLLLSVIASVWLSRRDRFSYSRSLLGGAALASLWPALPMTQYTVKDDVPPFFEQGTYRRYLPAQANILILPLGESGYSLLWQAQANFHFRIAQGRLMANEMPPEFTDWPIVEALGQNNPYIPDYSTQFAAFLVSREIEAAVLRSDDDRDYQRLFDELPCRRIEVGGIVIYQIDLSKLKDLKSVSGLQMETRYNLERIRKLLESARRALDIGLRPDQIDAVTLRERGMLTVGVAGFRLDAQLPGYGATAGLRSSRALRWLLGQVVRHAHLNYRLMAELGLAPSPGLTTTGVWLGPWDRGGIAVGVVSDSRAVAALIDRYGGRARRIYYPYPLQFRAGAALPSGKNLLLMIFAPSMLQAGGNSAVAPPAAEGHVWPNPMQKPAPKEMIWR